MADDADALVVAAILQYFVMLVACGIQIIIKKASQKVLGKAMVNTENRSRRLPLVVQRPAEY